MLFPGQAKSNAIKQIVLKNADCPSISFCTIGRKVLSEQMSALQLAGERTEQNTANKGACAKGTHCQPPAQK